MIHEVTPENNNNFMIILCVQAILDHNTPLLRLYFMKQYHHNPQAAIHIIFFHIILPECPALQKISMILLQV